MCYKFNCHTYFWIRNSEAGGLVTAVGRDTLNESTNYIPDWQSGVRAQYLLVHPQSKFPPHDTVIDISNNIYTVLDISTCYIYPVLFVYLDCNAPRLSQSRCSCDPGHQNFRPLHNCIQRHSCRIQSWARYLSQKCDQLWPWLLLEETETIRSTNNILQNDISNSDYNAILCIRVAIQWGLTK